MYYPDCKTCKWFLTCAVRYYSLNIKYCQYEEVKIRLNQEEKENEKT